MFIASELCRSSVSLLFSQFIIIIIKIIIIIIIITIIFIYFVLIVHITMTILFVYNRVHVIKSKSALTQMNKKNEVHDVIIIIIIRHSRPRLQT